MLIEYAGDKVIYGFQRILYQQDKFIRFTVYEY